MLLLGRSVATLIGGYIMSLLGRLVAKRNSIMSNRQWILQVILACSAVPASFVFSGWGEVHDGETASAVQKGPWPRRGRDTIIPSNHQRAYIRSVLADFSARDQMPQAAAGAKDKLGRKAATYPKVVVPAQVSFESESWPNDPIYWQRLRISAAAQHFEGVKYAHHHIPEDGGLDCSNYVAWVYNWAGILKFLGDVHEQGPNLINNFHAQKILNWSELEMGDIIYLRKSDTFPDHTPTHAAIFLGPDLVRDSMEERGGVTSHDPTKIRPTFQSRFEYGVRIIK